MRRFEKLSIALLTLGLILCGFEIPEAKADANHRCISVNGEIKVQEGNATCNSVDPGEGEDNVATAFGDGSEATAGIYPGVDSGNRAHARNGAEASALAGVGGVAHADGPGAFAGCEFTFGPCTARAKGELASAYGYGGAELRVRATGFQSCAEAGDGVDLEAAARGERAEALVYRSDRSMGHATGTGAIAFVDSGDDNLAIARGDNAYAEASEGDRNQAEARADGASATATKGDDNLAIATGACVALATGGNQTDSCP